MQLWPVLLWAKPKARQHNRTPHLHFATRTYSTPPATLMATFLYTFVLNALLLTTSTWGLTVTQHLSGNYDGVNAVNADGEVGTALTGLSNVYATSNYMKNYYGINESEDFKQQQQQQQQQQQKNDVAIAANLGQTEEMDGRGFVALQPSFYRNSIVDRGTSGMAAGGGVQVDGFNVYNGGFVPTTFTAAGQHFAASLVGQQIASDKSNTLHQYATTAANKNNLHANYQPYVNVNSNGNNNNNNDMVAEADNNKAQHTLFRRLSNYDGSGSDRASSGSDGDEATAAGVDVEDDAGDDGGAGGDDAIAATANAKVMQNYGLAYADDAQQSPLLQNFYNQQTPFNGAQFVHGQTFVNYFPPTVVASTAGYDVENQQKYYTFNNYQQTTKSPQLQQQYEQHQYAQYQKQQQPHELQQNQQAYNKLDILTATQAPATYYQTYIQHKNDVGDHHHRHVADDNYHRWKQNQIMANYQPKITAIEKQQQPPQQPQSQQQQQRHQQSHQDSNQYDQDRVLQEPEAAETSHNSRLKKSPKHKSKRHDNHDKHDEHNYNYDVLLEQNDNNIDHGTQDFASIQFQQLEKLQEQLQHQQQQFVELQHQLIDHDQQLQIQKHIANNPASTLPPITQTVHHNPHSLQALAGSPLSKHTQIIKTIPVPQHHQVHVPYRENVTVEVPDPIIAPIRKPFAIKIPVTRTVTVPKIQEVKIPIEKVKPFPVERPIPYIVERRVPYPVEKQVAQPVYYPVPIKVPILHTIIHKLHRPHGAQQHSYHLPHTVYRKRHGNGYGHSYGQVHGHSHYN